MSGLDSIQKGVFKRPRRVMLYGVEGIGKSTFGSLAQNPIFIPTEDGLNDIDCESFPVAEDLDAFLENIAVLIRDEHKYKTVIVDSADWLERLIFSEVCREKNVKSIEDIGYAKGYKFALDHWDRFLSGLNILRDQKGMMIMLLAHSQVERFEAPEGDSYDRYMPRLHKLASGLVLQWCDEVFFATYKITVKKEDKGFNKKRGIGVDRDERVMKCTEKASHMAKNRLGMDDEVPFEWISYANELA